jgi:hypothetical protein
MKTCCTAGRGGLCLPIRDPTPSRIAVRSASFPTWRRGSASDWSAGIQTRSSCCDSSSALAGHGFWPQIERNLGMKQKWQVWSCAFRELEILHSRGSHLHIVWVPLPSTWQEYFLPLTIIFCSWEEKIKSIPPLHPASSLEVLRNTVPSNRQLVKSPGRWGRGGEERMGDCSEEEGWECHKQATHSTLLWWRWAPLPVVRTQVPIITRTCDNYEYAQKWENLSGDQRLPKFLILWGIEKNIQLLRPIDQIIWCLVMNSVRIIT